ncbi:unnamed protein product [Adineta steineri]|uniref:Secondary thiamine-phosphate synthase enzyme n=1 Tax=Adineta steineri TaxID=433720 RepID=A0A813QZ13_9BILA|nr:unnamed protein product [Adineta steineri]
MADTVSSSYPTSASPRNLDQQFTQHQYAYQARVHSPGGKDDMPAHAKCSLLGASINIPISSGRLAFGTWQGIYLCEHRNRGGNRKIVVTINGQPKQ